MSYRRSYDDDGSVWGWVVGVVLVLVVVVGAVWFFTTVKQINPGYVGIVFDKSTHTVKADGLEPGWVTINPFTQSIQEYPVTVQTYDMVADDHEGTVQGNDAVKVQSSEGQQLLLDVVVQYQVHKQDAGALYKDWGGASISTIEDRVVRQYTRSVVPAFTAKYGWESLLSSRAEIEQAISEQLSKEFTQRHIDLVTFNIREVHLSAELQAALNKKIEAQQLAEQQKYALQQAKVKAEQDLAQAQGEANATLAKAKAQAEANELLSRSITPELVRYREIEKWNGELPRVSGTTSTIVGSDIFTGTVK